MQQALIFYSVAILTGLLPATAVFAETPYSSLPLSQLEQRLAEIDAELGQLAHYSLRSGIGSIGCRSMWRTNSTIGEWFEIELERETPLDEIVLIPALWRDAEKGFQADGFPDEFRITVGTANDRTGTVLGEYRSADGILPRIAPLVISANGMPASWARIEATRLAPRAFDQHYVFQLSEVCVFSGSENVVLRRPVNVSSSHTERSGSSWNPSFLVDGHMPYLMDAAEGHPSVAYLSPKHREKPTLTLDLEDQVPLSSIHLHAMEQSDTVPQAYAGDMGIPRHLRVEGASSPDFSDATVLLETRQDAINDTGPIMMWHFPETTCRYVRLSDASTSPPYRIGFAEIELYSHGRNAALGKPVHTDDASRRPDTNRSLAALTDGQNLYGAILPIRTWLNELARRHDLEAERPLVMDELNKRYARQKANLNRMTWLAALLVATVGFTILIDRMLRQRQIARIRERFAADLHDELGANLHAIGLLGDLAKDAVHSPEDLIETVDEIRALTERSGAAARHCVDMQQADIYGKLPDDMQRTARRIMADLDYDISIEGEQMLEKLKPRTKSDLFLFYKESLVNISRHSEANEVRTNLTADRNEVCLTISDNGHGLEGEVPLSLKRRARLLGGHATISTSESGGTCITLRFKPRRFGVRSSNLQ
ncbi:histidine kinase [Pontiellaceae bacterium B12227]|nr:histidine kinase [Pontiellaceae bacterium B12227]